MIIKLTHYLNDDDTFQLELVTKTPETHSILSENPHVVEALTLAIHKVISSHFSRKPNELD